MEEGKAPSGLAVRIDSVHKTDDLVAPDFRTSISADEPIQVIETGPAVLRPGDVPVVG
ncbi:hypothetical protein [Embleya scabrispora]|uniref:hypothetical protein n=1 Tax=Embleya scabrispora TaxID=159449 RepID=UPI001374F126|nr:hypothetical protein [Embleya scabrispora]